MLSFPSPLQFQPRPAPGLPQVLGLGMRSGAFGHLIEWPLPLRAFAGLPDLSVESPVVLAETLDCAERGMEFADALHQGAAARCEAVLTFDLRFIGPAGDMAVKVIGR